MDFEHINKYPGAENCKKKHVRYVWPTTTGVNEVIIIADSLLKPMKALRKTVVHAVPGADIERLSGEIRRGTIIVHGYMAVLISAGTNSLEKNTPTQLCDQMATLIEQVRHLNSTCKIIVTGILTRPRDEDNGIKFTVEGNPSLSPKRSESNTLLKEMVLAKKCTFLSIWKSLEIKGITNVDNYCDDGLHLSPTGLYRIRLNLLSNIGRELAVHPPSTKTPKSKAKAAKPSSTISTPDK
jgi:lysophospholipase L1-like esterase